MFNINNFNPVGRPSAPAPCTCASLLVGPYDKVCGVDTGHEKRSGGKDGMME